MYAYSLVEREGRVRELGRGKWGGKRRGKGREGVFANFGVHVHTHTRAYCTHTLLGTFSSTHTHVHTHLTHHKAVAINLMVYRLEGIEGKAMLKLCLNRPSNHIAQ